MEIKNWYALYTRSRAEKKVKKLLEENQLENLAKIFTEKRYTKKDNQYFSDIFLDVIKKQGFI